MRFLMYLIGCFFYYLETAKNIFISNYFQIYYYKKIKKIGKGVRFNGISRITGLDNIEIGNNVHIGNNAFIRGDGGLIIGDNTHISRNLVLYTQNHNYEGELLPYDSTFINKKVVIEKNVWIGMNVVILPGAHIKEGSIIGAGSVVSGVYDSLTVFGAPKAVKIKERNPKHYEKLDKEGKFGGKNGEPIN